jgi:hypothetical protein
MIKCCFYSDTCADFLLQLVHSPAFSVFTPHSPRSVRSPTPGPDFTARSPRSLTPGLDFQTLSIIDPQPQSLPDPLAAVVEEGAIVNEGMCQSSSSCISQRDEDNFLVVNDSLETSIFSVLAEETAAITDLVQGLPIISQPPAEGATAGGDDVRRPSPSAAWHIAAEQAADKSTQDSVKKAMREAEARSWRRVFPQQHAHAHWPYWKRRGLVEIVTWIWSCVRDISIWFDSIA